GPGDAASAAAEDAPSASASSHSSGGCGCHVANEPQGGSLAALGLLAAACALARRRSRPE
ncbi:MAG: MYXO-CTERM sorting domain-containing protein, partial [Polyangiaceae bacterium]